MKEYALARCTGKINGVVHYRVLIAVEISKPHHRARAADIVRKWNKETHPSHIADRWDIQMRPAMGDLRERIYG